VDACGVAEGGTVVALITRSHLSVPHVIGLLKFLGLARWVGLKRPAHAAHLGSKNPTDARGIQAASCGFASSSVLPGVWLLAHEDAG
jgi:hypothetical protein